MDCLEVLLFIYRRSLYTMISVFVCYTSAIFSVILHIEVFTIYVDKGTNLLKIYRYWVSHA